MNARVPHIDTTEAGCAARTARIEAAQQARQVRADSIDAAQRVYRKYKLRGNEVLRALQNIEAAIDLPQDAWIKDVLVELCCDIEDVNEAPPELEALPRSLPPEFDAQTVGVRHRSVA